MDDRVLARAIASGDRDAFRTLVDRESARVYRTCYRIVGRADEAEDAAQESFVNAFRAIRTYRGDGPLGAWLARIAIRQSFRRLAQRADADPYDPTESGAGDASGEPLAMALAAERHDSIRGAVARLPEPYREVVVLRFFGDLQLAEVAAATGRPLGTVKTHLRRGLERLRRALDGEAAE
ncbi:MAG: RNA polymerase sigma factor [Candidatus Limnocylindria bacterium]